MPWAEYVYNTAYQSSLRETPFRVVYGRDPPTIRSYEPGDTRVAAVARNMEERDEFLADIRYRLEQAQAVQKKHYDKLHRHVAYQVGDWALLRLRQRAASSIPQAVTGKLKPRYFGPYRVVELINDVAVRLALPPRARLHDVFHIGLLKKFQGTPPDAPPPLPVIHNGAAIPVRRAHKRCHVGAITKLVQWVLMRAWPVYFASLFTSCNIYLFFNNLAPTTDRGYTMFGLEHRKEDHGSIRGMP